MKEEIVFEPIISPVDPSIIEDALRMNDREDTNPFFVRNTRSTTRKIFRFTAPQCPECMDEVGRLREDTFRDAQGGTGKTKDVDEYDLGISPHGPVPLFNQLVMWDTTRRKIISAYRYVLGSEIIKYGMKSPNFDIFDCSETYKRDRLPYGIELGRSIVIPELQKAKEGIFIFDGMMDGLGSLVVDYPYIKYFFGKFTMYTHYNTKARDLILYYLNKHFGDTAGLITPHKELAIIPDYTGFDKLFTGRPKIDRFDERKLLIKTVRELGEDIPPLVNYYESLSLTMTFSGMALNPHFGGVQEGEIEIIIDDIYQEKKDRHVKTYNPHNCM